MKYLPKKVKTYFKNSFVILANAGIHISRVLDSRLHGNDKRSKWDIKRESNRQIHTSKLFRFSDIRIFDLFRISDFGFRVLKPGTARKFIVVFLIVTIALENVLVPLAYAQQIAPDAEVAKEEFTTLITDTDLEGTDPYIGEGRGVRSVIPALTDMSMSNGSASVLTPSRVHKLAKVNYRPNEEIKVVIDNGLNKEFKTEFIDAIGNKVAMETSEIQTGSTKVITVEQPSSFRPGKYTLRISDGKGGVSEQDFSWGVLAVNPDKSIYAPNEVANLAIGVLDEAGNMVCDAQVELQITGPAGKMDSLSTDNGKIIINPECKSHDFTLKPDYETNYQTGITGVYKMLLKAQTKNGAYSITDSFEVRENVPFDVKRVTATRIYPPNVYPVTMEITANQDFDGTITETVPASFRIAPQGSEIKTENQKIEDVIAPIENPKSEAPNSKQMQNSNEPNTKRLENSDLENSSIVSDFGFRNSNLSSNVVAYNTINNIQESLGGPSVLGSSIPGLSMPFNGPYPITQEFGESLVNDIHDHDLYESFGMHGHDGIDFAMPEGTPLVAVDGGKVLVAGDGDYGTTIILQHAWGRSYYGHLSGVDVKEGQEVSRGSVIGKSGNTGISTGPHLHFGLKPEKNETENGYYGKVDPAYYLGMKQSAGAVLGVSTSIEPDAPVETDIKVLTWKVNVKKGDKIKIGYNYLAPRISPQFYTLGPATFTDTSGNEVFHEIRKWQIASDALEYKFKRGSFSKSTCTAPCTQSVAGVGFKPKAVIFEWTNQTATGTTTSQHFGSGFATSPTEERAVSSHSDDAELASDSCRVRTASKVIVMISPDCASDSIGAQADLVSFDTDGFTLNWTTNNASAYIVHYTVVGGADVISAKVGTFSFTTGLGSLAVTDPGFQPDFLMFMGAGATTLDDVDLHSFIHLGYASSSSKEGGLAVVSEDARATSDTFRWQSTTSSLTLLSPSAGGQDAEANITSFDATGFTIDKTNAIGTASDVFYLALQGGQYDVGSLTQPTAAGEQSVYTGFRPAGVSLASYGTTASATVTTTNAISLGGASKESGVPWCDDTSGTQCTIAWSERKKITFNNSASAENLTSFPVLVKLDSSRIDYNKTQNSGQDIRFVDPTDPNVVLSHEIESWNEAGDSFVWVKVPQLDAGSNTDHLWMYYGNSSASDGQDVTGVWTNGYESVHHLHDDYLNSTSSSGRDGTNNGTIATSAQVANGADFELNDVTDNINAGTWSVSGSQLTIQSWVRFETIGTSPRLLSKATGIAEQDHVYMLSRAASGGDRLRFRLKTGTDDATGTTTLIASSGELDPAIWYLATGTYDGVNMRIYLNGAEVGTVAKTGSIRENAWSVLFGNNNTDDDPLDGLLDEVRISSTARSADWIEAEYVNQNDSMNTFGTAEVYGVGTQLFSEGSIWADDRDNEATINANMSTVTTKAIHMAESPTGGGAATTTAEADMQSFDSTGFTLGWTTTDATARQVLYWAVGSVTASQEDYRWYKNANSLTPGSALEDENQATLIAKNKPTARLRASLSVGGNGLNADTQGYKLQYAAAGAEAAVGGTTDWCNDTTGVTCTAPASEAAPSTTPTDWCNDTTGVTCTSSWTSRKSITFDNSGASTDLTDFPVLVKLDSTRINYAKTQASGEDLRFVDPSDPTVVLNHEIESWNESGSSYVWVKVPSVDAQSSTDSIWMYYGNSIVGSPATQLGNATHGSGTWDSSFRALYHMKENPAVVNCPTNKELCDSTTNANNADANGTIVSGAQVPGKINGSIDNNPTDNRYVAPDSSSLDITGTVTLSVWARADTLTGGSWYSLINKEDSVTATSNYGLQIINTGVLAFFFGSGGSYTESLSNQTIVPGQWYHFAITYDDTANQVKLYINGVLDATRTQSLSISANNHPLIIGASTDGTLENWDGLMDQIEIEATVRSDDWIKAEYLTGNDQYATYGSEFSYNETQQSSSGWEFRKTITLNNSASAENLIDFPVLVKLDSSKIDYSKTQDDGGDLRFVDPADRTTVLSHEIESWNENGTSYVWVKVPQIDTGSTTDYMYMYYGNPGVADGQNATGVWDSSTVMVQHLEEAAGCATFTDSTANGHNGTCLSAPAINTSAKIGSGRTFDGSDDGITIPDNAAFEPGSGGQTIEAWVNSRSFTGDYQSIFDHAGSGGYAFYLGGTTPFSTCNLPGELCYYENSGDQGSGTVLGAATWTHVAAVKSGTTVTFYVNGVVSGSITIINPINETEEIVIGLSNFTTGAFTGTIDEVRYSSTSRSAEWIEATYLTQNDQMSVIGEEQPFTTGGTATAGWTDVADVWCNDASGVLCNTSWGNRKRITIDNQSSSTDLTNFPVLVKLDSTRIDYTKTQDDGDDLRFVDPANPSVALSHEIESWNENGESFVWVEVPTLDAKSTSDSIWMYYSNASVGSGQDPTGVWDSNFMGVYHLKENPTLTCSGTSEVCDSTANANHAENDYGMTAGQQTTGKVGNTLNFQGTGLRVADSVSLDTITATLTTSAWMNADELGAFYYRVISRNDDPNQQWYMEHDGAAPGRFINDGGFVGGQSTGSFEVGTWYYVTMVTSASGMSFYINGTLDSQFAGTGAIGTVGDIGIGANPVGSSPWYGKLDEVRISNLDRSVDWVKAEYLTMTDTMNTFGNEETQTSAVWKFKDNSNVTNGATLTSGVLGTSTAGNQMSYQEANPTTLNPSSLAVGEKREFDFSLDGTLTSNRRTYYFRIVTADGEPLTNYTRYPSITVGVPNQKVMRGGKFFNYKQAQPFSF